MTSRRSFGIAPDRSGERSAHPQRADWADGLGKTFQRHLQTAGDGALDCGCALEHGAFDTFGGALRTVPTDGGLVTFLFRLLAQLQSVGTVPAIDWAAYARILDEAR